MPVECLCEQYQECGCDDNGDTAYLSDLVALNQTNTTAFAIVNGTQTLLVNGTLANGTLDSTSGASLNAQTKLSTVGYAVMVAIVLVMVSGI